MLAIRVLAILYIVSVESLQYGKTAKRDMTSYNDGTSRDMKAEQELDRLMTQLVESKEKTSAVSVRLADGRGKHEGRVEVHHNGRWGTMCDDLTKKEANVICRTLGYPGAVMATVGGSFGRGPRPISFNKVRCHGHEQSIDECDHQGWGKRNCQHSERDAGVICQQKADALPTTTAPPASMLGVDVICLPHAMYIRISKRSLQQMTSQDFNPGLLHLYNSSCGIAKETKTHVLLGTTLNSCGTKRRQIGDYLTYTNKVIVDSSYGKRGARTALFEFPFSCSYTRRNTRRMLAPPQRHGYNIGQW